MNKKLISIVSGCYNEQGNLNELYERVSKIMAALDSYDYEFILIDNASQDNTQKILRCLAKKDNRVKVILNTRNFGNNRSGYHALLQARGDAIICMASDLQDPPELITDFVKWWEQGYKIVLAVKTSSEECRIVFGLRRLYYYLLDKSSETPLIANATGFGLYDRQAMDLIKEVKDPNPYFRGLLAELGFEVATVDFVQPRRKRGVTKNNFYTLFDTAMLGLVSHSRLPLRIATMSGIMLAVISLVVGLFYGVYKLIYWNSFTVGIAPLVIGFFFISSFQLLFIGLLGEYVGSIHHKSLNRPIVVEKERINFD
jgi:polyisoprenyl-phosphate glycosyltransferase